MAEEVIVGQKKRAVKPKSGKKKNASAKKVLADSDIRTIREGTLADFFARSPLRGSGLELPARDRVRKINL